MPGTVDFAAHVFCQPCRVSLDTVYRLQSLIQLALSLLDQLYKHLLPCRAIPISPDPAPSTLPAEPVASAHPCVSSSRLPLSPTNASTPLVTTPTATTVTPVTSHPIGGSVPVVARQTVIPVGQIPVRTVTTNVMGAAWSMTVTLLSQVSQRC